ncbi:electon transport protein SCO1/SCO2 [Angomonas deanei]|nr:electon transport protein SCO1/SCO2 [Angomonas deanei]|eukprot:EPY39273.1 electon transport protein SCO1/SCO2 [Angomonas deanei]
MWLLWGLLAVTLAVLTVVMSLRIRKEQMRFDPRLRAVKAFDSDEGVSIGGPFELKDAFTGKKVTEKDFEGKWMYVYFGFTNCPDVCPEEMAKMTRVIRHLDKKVGKDYWEPVFVSLDPKRDTPEKIKEYLSEFSPRIRGLYGTTEQVEAAARQYRVYFAIPDEEAMSEDDYLIDHSIIMYLMDPSGKFCDYTTKEFQWFESYSKLLRRMMDYEREKAVAQQKEKLENNGKIKDGETPANMRVATVGSVTDEQRKAAEEAARQNPALPSKSPLLKQK